MEVLQEAYFGKLPQLLQVEELFEKMKIKYQKPDGGVDKQIFYKEIIKDESLKRIENIIRDMFGFNEVVLTIENNNSPNACTLVYLSDPNGNPYGKTVLLKDIIANNKQIKDALIVTREGFKFNNKVFSPNLLILFSCGLIFNKNISSPEIVAVMLHEIGHNFTKSIVDIPTYNARIDEKFADRFAAMYGYAAELNKCLTKITLDHGYGMFEKIRHIPIVNIFAGMAYITDKFISRAVFGSDVHPSVNSRMVDTIKQMEHDLRNAKDLSPRMKKELERDIALAKQQMADFYNTDNDNVADKMSKKYLKDYEGNHNNEIDQDAYADKYAGIETINQIISNKIVGKPINPPIKKVGYFSKV